MPEKVDIAEVTRTVIAKQAVEIEILQRRVAALQQRVQELTPDPADDEGNQEGTR